MEFWSAGCPDGDSRRTIFEKRSQCYDLALDSLSVLNSNKTLSECLRYQDIDDIYDLPFNFDDPIFHSYLYNWFIANGMINILLEVRLMKLSQDLYNQEFGRKALSI